MSKNIKMSIATKTREAITNTFSSLEGIKKNIIILDELKRFIPPLLDTEYEQLKLNLVTNGCKDPLLLWETTLSDINQGITDEIAYILIDGHNRFQICTELGINFNIQLLAFDSIAKVKEHMIDLQLGRRNLNTQQASYLRGLRYNNEKANVLDNLVLKNETDQNAIFPNGQSDHLGNSNDLTTAQRLAEEYKVGEKTIRRDAAFAEGLDKLNPILKNEILSGKTKVDRSKIQSLAKNKAIQEPISEVNQIELYLKSSNDIKKPKVVIEVGSDEIVAQKYNNVLSLISLAFRTRKKEDLALAQVAFEDFKASI